MKHTIYALLTMLILSATSCVQKSYKKTVIVMLTVANKKDIQTVGVRGEGQPLSWDNDLEMKAVVKDSLYTATVTAVTGYRFAECKFTVNGEFELKDQPNRRVNLSDQDTTFYNAQFDVISKN